MRRRRASPSASRRTARSSTATSAWPPRAWGAVLHLNGRSFRPDAGMQVSGNDKITVMRSMGDDQQVSISRRTLDGIDETTKHVSWSYEQEVRLTATVRKDLLGGHESQIRCVRVPLEITEDFVSRRVYDSPVSDGRGTYRDSELLRTVEWDLCSGCALKRKA